MSINKETIRGPREWNKGYERCNICDAEKTLLIFYAQSREGLQTIICSNCYYGFVVDIATQNVVDILEGKAEI